MQKKNKKIRKLNNFMVFGFLKKKKPEEIVKETEGLISCAQGLLRTMELELYMLNIELRDLESGEIGDKEEIYETGKRVITLLSGIDFELSYLYKIRDKLKDRIEKLKKEYRGLEQKHKDEIGHVVYDLSYAENLIGRRMERLRPKISEGYTRAKNLGLITKKLYEKKKKKLGLKTIILLLTGIGSIGLAYTFLTTPNIAGYFVLPTFESLALSLIFLVIIVFAYIFLFRKK